MDTPTKVQLVPFSLFGRMHDPPNRHRALAVQTILNRYGTPVTVMVEENWPHTRWWLTASIGGMRISNGRTTTSKAKAAEWVAAVGAGNVNVDI